MTWRRFSLVLFSAFFPVFAALPALAQKVNGACLYALDPHAPEAFQVSGDAEVTTNCSFVVESDSASAFTLRGDDRLYLGNHAQVGVVGGWRLKAKSMIDKISDQPVQPVNIANPGDPLASIPAPTQGTIVSFAPVTYSRRNHPANNSLLPGVYCGGISIEDTDAQYTMSPGIYVMAGGGFNLAADANVAGNGVTIFNTSSTAWGCRASYRFRPITIDGRASLALSAPASGPWAGIVVFGDRHGCPEPGTCTDRIDGRARVSLNGIVYLKSDQLEFTGATLSGGCMEVVADKVVMHGRTDSPSNGCFLKPISVSVSATGGSLYGGQTQQFIAAVANTYFTNVTWSISPALGTIDQTGNYTAPQPITTMQTVTVTATSQNDTTKSASQTITLLPPVTPTIAWAAPQAITYGIPLSAAQLNATVDGMGTLSYSPSASTILRAGTHTLTAAFTPTNSNLYTPATATVALTVNQATPTITWAPPARIGYGMPLSSAQLDAQASVPGTFTYLPPAGTVLPIGTHSLSATFSPTDSIDYTTPTQSVPLTVLPFVMPGPGQIATMAGDGKQGYVGDGSNAVTAELNSPAGVAVDSSGNVYVADSQNNVVREVLAANNEIVTVAGTGTAGYSGDGAAATSAQLNGPAGVALDSSDNLYIADSNNSVIRIVNLTNGMISTFAGNGTAGYSGDGGNPINAELNAPTGIAVDSQGNLFVADTGNNVIRKITISNTSISTFAGNGIAGSSGDGGPATMAELNLPTSVTVDSAGTLYIADTLNQRIRKIAPATGIISAYAGQGQFGFSGDDGPALGAEFSSPTGVATDANGNLYITDVGNSVVREVSASDHVIHTIAGNGTWGYSGDYGPATSAQLGIDHFDAVAVDSSGNVYIADADNNAVRVVGGIKATPTLAVSASPGAVPFGAVSSTLTALLSSGTGSVSFSNGAGWASGPVPFVNGVATTVLSNAGWAAGVYSISAAYAGDVLDNSANASTTLAVSSAAKATPVITWVTPNPISTGTALSGAQLNATASVPGTFVYTPAAGTILPTGTNTITALFIPNDAADYNAATATVSLSVNASTGVRPGLGIISTIAGNGILGYSGDGGLATGAELSIFQSGVAADASGNIYISDWQDNVVRKVDAATGTITTIAGNGVQGYSGDGGAATSAELNGPAGVAVDAIGNIYIADAGNNVVRVVSPATNLITTIAGNGALGYAGDNGPASQAQLYFPFGLAVSANGDLYIAELGNNVIRKVASGTGVITTVAGTGTVGDAGDGTPATSATLSGPSGVAVDGSGNLYIADLGNNSIRAVFTAGSIPGLSNPVTGNIYTLVGSGSTVAIHSTLNNPEGVAADQAGNLYIADAGDNQVREVYSSGFIPNVANPVAGSIYTLAGTGSAGYTGDGGSATSATLNGPGGVAVDGASHLYIADSDNQVVRAIGTPAKSAMAISWPSPAAITYGTPVGASQFNAGTSIPGTFTYEPAAGSVLSAGTQLLGVTFTPSDMANYATVTGTTTLVVNKATPVITWPTPDPVIPGTALGAAQLNAIASVPGTFTYSPGAGTVPSLGPVTITVTFTPADSLDYTPATASVTLMVQRLTPTINWPTPAPITYGTPLNSAQLYATASVPGSFTFDPPAGTVLNAGMIGLTTFFTPANSTAYTTVSATVPLVVNKAAPIVTWQTPTAITSGTPLSADQLNAVANVAGTFTFSPAVGTVLPVGTTTLTATFAPADAADYSPATAQVQLAVNQALAAGTPLLQLRTSATPANVTLSNPEALDWIIWGANGSTTAATRMVGASLLSDITPLGSANITADLNGQIGYSWTGGTPTPSGNVVKAEMNTSGAGAGFQIIAPADTTVKTLLLYVNINSNAQLTASLSDGSSPTIVHAPSTPQDNGNEVYAIDYRAASSDQTLTVQLAASDASATVGLQAAVLEPHLPDVAVLSPLSGQSYPLSGTPIIVNADQFDSSIASVQLLVNGSNSTLLTSAPYETTLSLPAGHYSLMAQAKDSAGLTNASAPVEFNVIQSGGSLSDSFSQIAAGTNVDLTTEGTADWTLFAPSVYKGTQTERKAGVLPQISDFSVIGTGIYSQYSAVDWPGPFSFVDGSPDQEEPAVYGDSVVLGNPSNAPGFQFTAPADATPRTLRVYAQGCGNDVQMTAFLSDGSAPPIVDNSLTAAIRNNQNVYVLNYASATAGQTLTVRLTAQSENQGMYPPGLSEVCLTGASLSGGAAMAPAVNAITPQSGTAGMSVTISGADFGAAQGSSSVSIGGTPLTVQSWSSGNIQAVLPPGVQSGPVEVTTAIGSSNTNVAFTLAPTVTSLSPAIGPIGTVVTITGANLGASQGQGSVSFNGVSATPSSWSDTQVVVPVPSGATTGPVLVTQTAPATSSPMFVVNPARQGAPAPVLSVHIDDSPASVNLSDPVNLDWVVWQPANSAGNAVRKAGANLISDVTALNSTSQQQNQGSVQYSWTNGTPAATGVFQTAGIYGYSWSGNPTYQLTAPADMSVKTLKLYCNECGYVQLNVSISDGSSAPLTYIPAVIYDIGEQVFSIDYRAASPGQTLTVQVVSKPVGSDSYPRGISLEAAVLQPHAPQVSLVSPLDQQDFPAGSPISIGADAWQFDTNTTSLNISANGNQIFALQPPTSTATWSPQPGHYSIQAQAVDSAGLTGQSRPVTIDVIGAGGSLSQTRSSIPPTTDLTALGSADWIMPEYCGALPYAGAIRKQGVAPLISNFTTIGDEYASWVWSDNPTLFNSGTTSSNFSFEDGTPIGEDNTVACGLTTGNGVPGNGFQFTVNADTSPRTLYLFVAMYGGRGKLNAFLSDGSAPVVVDTSLASPLDTNSNYAYAEYAIHFNAASSGQTLTVQWTGDTALTPTYHNPYIQTEVYAAALDGPPAPPSAGPAVESVTPESGGVGMLVTIKGTGFGASQGSSTVTFNGITATPTSWSDTQIQVPAPLADNSGYIEVTVGGISSSPVIFSMPPTVTGLSCSLCVSGSTITINGYNFGPSQVRFSYPVLTSTRASAYSTLPQVVSWTDTQIQVVMPPVPSYWGTQMTLSVQKVDPFSNTGGESTSNLFAFATSPTPVASTIQWAAPAAIVYGTPLSPAQLNATASVPGTFTYSPAAGAVLGAGSQTLSVTFTPTDNLTYATATAQVSLQVAPALPAISWPTSAQVVYGTPLSTAILDATASVPGTFVYTPSLGNIPIVGSNTLTVNFTPTDSVDYATASATTTLLVTPGRKGIEIPPPGIIGPLAGNGTSCGAGDGGDATTAELNRPFGIAVDAAGNVYIADANNNVVREVNAATGAISVVAGDYTAGYTGDNGLASASELNSPNGVAVDSTGNLYVADTGNNAIRFVNASTGTITTLAGDGSGKSGYLGDGGPASAAEFNNPTSVAVDKSGNVYVADWMNNAIRRIDATTGTVSTVAGDPSGQAGFAGDSGPATGALLNRPFAVAVDISGDIYIADTNNNRIREIYANNGEINTIVGNGDAGYSGDDGAATSAEIAQPMGVAVDASENIFFADSLNNAIREVPVNSNVVTTVAGYGLPGYGGDGGEGIRAQLSSPVGVATDVLMVLNGSSSMARAKGTAQSVAAHPALAGGGGGAGGNLYLCDSGNSKCRVVGNPTRNKPGFRVQEGQYLAWAYPTTASATGDATVADNGDSGSGSFYGPGTITWKGFTSNSLPSQATVQGVYGVAAYTATSLNGLTANLTSGGQTLNPPPVNGIGVSQTQSLGTSLPPDITATLSESKSTLGSLDITAAAVAETFTIPPRQPSPPGSCENGGNAANQCQSPSCPSSWPTVPAYVNGRFVAFAICCPPGSVAEVDGKCTDTPPSSPPPPPTPIYTLTLVNPNALLTSTSKVIYPEEIINSGVTASGIIADGTSTAVAVLKIDPQGGPLPDGDVTFTVTNGATVAPWDPMFPSTAPGPLSTSDQTGKTTELDVPGGSLIQVGGAYYALALVTSGLPSTTTLGEPIDVTTTAGGSNERDQYLTTYAPPVLLIHGLWGNASSLKSTRKALKTSSRSVYPICYSTYIAYYAQSPDTYSGDPCQETSTTALDSTLNDIYNTWISSDIVGGRVDVVAHSMGGLVVRNYSTSPGTPKYYNAFNRYQGTFRDIVTLDTPQTGSPFAWYLDNVLATKKEDPSQYPTLVSNFDGIPVPSFPSSSSALWSALCGLNRNTTFRDCVAAMPWGFPYGIKMPLAVPSAPLDTGAVASLMPDDKHLKSLPNPNLPNATWYSIAGDYQAGGSSLPSTLEAFLNQFIGALYSLTDNGNGQVLTVKKIMTYPGQGGGANAPDTCSDGSAGFFDNDVIVPLCSQTYYAIPGQSHIFPGVAHTDLKLPAWAESAVAKATATISAPSVTRSDAVNALVDYWLSGEAGTPPVTNTQSALTATAVDNALVRNQLTQTLAFVRVRTTDRVKVNLPERPVEVAQLMRIPLKLRGPGATAIYVTQDDGNSILENRQQHTAIGNGLARVVAEDEAGKTIEITPLQVGDLHLKVVVEFSDGAEEIENYTVNVVPTSTGLEDFTLHQGLKVLTLDHGKRSQMNARFLEPEAYYEDLDYPIDLPRNLSDVKVTIDQPEASPVINIDHEGKIHALRPGKAAITGEFGGRKDQVVIIVK